MPVPEAFEFKVVFVRQNWNPSIKSRKQGIAINRKFTLHKQNKLTTGHQN